MLDTLLLLLATLGCWRTIPLDEHVQARPLIVQATLTTIDRAPPPLSLEESEPQRYDRATLRLDAVLKTPDATITVPGTIVLLMPAADRGVRRSTDLTFEPGTTGIWMLNRVADGWMATHPDDLQAPAQIAIIRRHLAEQAGARR